VLFFKLFSSISCRHLSAHNVHRCAHARKRAPQPQRAAARGVCVAAVSWCGGLLLRYWLAAGCALRVRVCRCAGAVCWEGLHTRVVSDATDASHFHFSHMAYAHGVC
jgi:hypothetical protein